MSQENLSNSQSQIATQETLTEITTRSESIIKEKCRDDLALSTLNKDLEDFKRSIEEKRVQLAEAEKEKLELRNTFEELKIARMSVQSDAEKIEKSVAEYAELFKDLKISVAAVESSCDENKKIIEKFSQELVDCSTDNMRYKEKLREYQETKKILEELKDSNMKLRNAQQQQLDDKKMELVSLEKEEQDLLNEVENLQLKNKKLKDELKMGNKTKAKLQVELQIKKEKFVEAVKDYETDKLNKDSQIDELKAEFNKQTEIISGLENQLEELHRERNTQICSKEEINNHIYNFQQQLSQSRTMLENQHEEKLKCQKIIEDLRSEASKYIGNEEKKLINLNEELNKSNLSNDELQVNIKKDKKILDDLKHQEDFKKKEIKKLQNNLKEVTTNIEEKEIKHTGIINEYNVKIKEIQTKQQELINRKDNLIKEKNNIFQKISDLQQKKTKRINESIQIQAEQNKTKNKLNEEIANLRNALLVLEEDFKKETTNYDAQMETLSMIYKDCKNEILESTNLFKEEMDFIELNNEEKFKTKKNEFLYEQSKMKLQIGEFNAAIENLKEELKKVNGQIASEKTVKQTENYKPAKVSTKRISETKTKKDTKAKSDEKVFVWTTDEEEYKKKQKFQKLRLAQTPKKVQHEKTGTEKPAETKTSVLKPTSEPKNKKDTEEESEEEKLFEWTSDEEEYKQQQKKQKVRMTHAQKRGKNEKTDMTGNKKPKK